MLADIIKHMTPDRAFEDSYPQVQMCISLPHCWRFYAVELNWHVAWVTPESQMILALSYPDHVPFTQLLNLVPQFSSLQNRGTNSTTLSDCEE